METFESKKEGKKEKNGRKERESSRSIGKHIFSVTAVLLLGLISTMQRIVRPSVRTPFFEEVV